MGCKGKRFDDEAGQIMLQLRTDNLVYIGTVYISCVVFSGSVSFPYQRVERVNFNYHLCVYKRLQSIACSDRARRRFVFM